jgi:hypothetical protein
MEAIIKASWSNIQNDGVAALTLSEKSTVSPALSATDLPGGRTQILNVHSIKQIDRHPATGHEACSPESFSDTKNWFN